ncbi:tubulin polyglutamylase complex subunit 2 [Microplitis mediator]|uniref:tubulin polyglutamylase complex subunit 2 n=1 Tax=Microplitis mediator TaxID=375433 RepID=UPI0025530C9B|nr:tubulin polyglutamylase complex subunit 2 [Microplitis mediator]
MSFFVDIVTEDSFYENLTLGVVKLLEASPCVKNVKVERRSACERSAISSWEQKHCCLLPDDLKRFYASTDGFSLTWSLDIAGEEFSVGRMTINEFAALKRFIGSKEQQAEAESKSQDETDIPSLGGRCKLFEIDQCGVSKIFLVYHIRPDWDAEPGIWLFQDDNAAGNWYHLSDSFIKYFRMMLVHLGLPLWQYCAAGLDLPTWVEQTYYLVGPHLLPTTGKPTETISATMWKDGPLNTIDPAIFKSRDNKQRNSRKK